jgi:hypothetical protein
MRGSKDHYLCGDLNLNDIILLFFANQTLKFEPTCLSSKWVQSSLCIPRVFQNCFNNDDNELIKKKLHVNNKKLFE